MRGLLRPGLLINNQARSVRVVINSYVLTTMYVCMDGWMDGWMDGCLCMYACIFLYYT